MPDAVRRGCTAITLCWRCRLSDETLEDMSRRCQSGKITWLSLVLPLQLKPELDPLLVFIDPIVNMEQQVYLYCTAFDSDWLRIVMNRTGTPVVLEISL